MATYSNKRTECEELAMLRKAVFVSVVPELKRLINYIETGDFNAAETVSADLSDKQLLLLEYKSKQAIACAPVPEGV